MSACRIDVLKLRNACSKYKVLLAAYWRIFGGSNIEESLQLAFHGFNRWRIQEKINTSVSKFELKTFKMESLLACINVLFFILQKPWPPCQGCKAGQVPVAKAMIQQCYANGFWLH